MKHKTLYAGYGCSFLAFIVLRICQLGFTIESNTGFYKPQYENFWYISAAVIILSVAAITFFSFTDVDFNSRKKEGGLTATFCIITGVGFLIKAISSFSENFGAVPALLTLFAVVSAMACFINAYCIFGGKSGKTGWYTLMVPFWIIELVFVFVQNNDVSSVPHRFYEIVTAALGLVFAVCLAKDRAGMFSGISSKIMVALSLTASLFCLAFSLPNMVLFLAGKGSLLHDASFSDALYLSYGLFITVYIFSTFKLKKAS